MINIALLSAAHIHTRGFLEDIAKRENCKLVGIWDDVADRGRRYASEFQSTFEPDLEKMIANPDVHGFIVCAENTRHLPLLKAAIPAGKPIFCEKPFTTSSADARVAMGLARKHNTVVHMGYGVPFGPAIHGLAMLLEQVAVGKITHVRYRNSHNACYGRWFDSPDLQWFTRPDLAGGGAFMDLGTHAVHALRSVLGPVNRVMATIGNVSGVYPQVDDFGRALFEFASGVRGYVEASWIQQGGPGGFEVAGSKGVIWDIPGKGLQLCIPKAEPQPMPAAEAKPSRVGRLVAAIEGTLTREELDADLQCAADAVAIMEACYESARTGRWTDVPKV